MKYLKAAPFWILVAVLVIFSVSNREAVTITLFPFAYETEAPLYLVFFGGLFLGFLMAGLIMLWRSAAIGLERQRSGRERAALEKELARQEGRSKSSPPRDPAAEEASGAGPSGRQS